MRWLLAFAIILFAGGSQGASKPSVLFDGDSITALATPAIHQLLDPSYDIQVQAVIGIRINQSLPALKSALTLRPYAVVVNLGTNDALQGGTRPGWKTSWNKMIRVTKGTPCVVLTTINPIVDTLSHRPVAKGINHEIRSLVARNPLKYKVADWSGFLSRNARNQRTYLRPEPILIHPTPAGAAKLALLDQKALEKCGTRSP